MRLSSVLSAVRLPVDTAHVDMVGVLGSGDGGAEKLRVEKTGDDYMLSALSDFDEASIVLYVGNDSYTLRLLNGKAIPGNSENEEKQT